MSYGERYDKPEAGAGPAGIVSPGTAAEGSKRS